MLSFLFGVSLTLNIVFIIGIVIFLSVKNNVANKFVNTFNDDSVLKSSVDDEIVDKDSAKDFLKDDKVDFSSLLRRQFMFSYYVIELFDKTRLWLETAPANSGILLFITIGFLVSIWNLLYSLCSYFENKVNSKY